MRKYYSYDAETLEYTGEEEADPNQLEPGNYLLPAYATFTPPPEEIDKGQQCVYDAETDGWLVQAAPPPEAPAIDFKKQLDEIPDFNLLGHETIGDLFDA